MASAAADLRVLAAAVLAKLTAAGLTVYDGEAALNATPPYGVLYEVSDTFDGPMTATTVDARRTFQVTAVGTTAEQKRWMADKVDAALTGTAPAAWTVTGRALMGLVEHVGGRDLGRDDDTAGPPLFSRADDYAFRTTPTA